MVKGAFNANDHAFSPFSVDSLELADALERHFRELRPLYAPLEYNRLIRGYRHIPYGDVSDLHSREHREAVRWPVRIATTALGAINLGLVYNTHHLICGDRGTRISRRVIDGIARHLVAEVDGMPLITTDSVNISNSHQRPFDATMASWVAERFPRAGDRAFMVDDLGGTGHTFYAMKALFEGANPGSAVACMELYPARPPWRDSLQPGPVDIRAGLIEMPELTEEELARINDPYERRRAAMQHLEARSYPTDEDVKRAPDGETRAMLLSLQRTNAQMDEAIATLCELTAPHISLQGWRETRDFDPVSTRIQVEPAVQELVTLKVASLTSTPGL
jgi:hypothetical protein